MNTYDVFVQFKSAPDLEFNIQATDVEHAELLVKELHPLATDIWITSMSEEAA